MDKLSQEIQSEIEKITVKIKGYQRRGMKYFASSSFQSHSIPMLHILTRIDPEIPIYFLDTGFHFPETLTFRDQICKLLNTCATKLTSLAPKVTQRDIHGNLLFTSDPDRCCYLNKVLPLEPILKSNDIWISGVRRDQTAFRADLMEEQDGALDTMRYHPMLEWTNKMIWEYRKIYSLPEHPLEAKGYLSIGCMPCTRKYELDDSDSGRIGRWSGMTKAECGIHTELTIK